MKPSPPSSEGDRDTKLWIQLPHDITFLTTIVTKNTWSTTEGPIQSISVTVSVSNGAEFLRFVWNINFGVPECSDIPMSQKAWTLQWDDITSHNFSVSTSYFSIQKLKFKLMPGTKKNILERIKSNHLPNLHFWGIPKHQSQKFEALLYLPPPPQGDGSPISPSQPVKLMNCDRIHPANQWLALEVSHHFLGVVYVNDCRQFSWFHQHFKKTQTVFEKWMPVSIYSYSMLFSSYLPGLKTDRLMLCPPDLTNTSCHRASLNCASTLGTDSHLFFSIMSTTLRHIYRPQFWSISSVVRIISIKTSPPRKKPSIHWGNNRGHPKKSWIKSL